MVVLLLLLLPMSFDARFSSLHFRSGHLNSENYLRQSAQRKSLNTFMDSYEPIKHPSPRALSAHLYPQKNMAGAKMPMFHRTIRRQFLLSTATAARWTVSTNHRKRQAAATAAEKIRNNMPSNKHFIQRGWIERYSCESINVLYDKQPKTMEPNTFHSAENMHREPNERIAAEWDGIMRGNV